MKRRILFAAALTALTMLAGCSLDPVSSHLTTQPPEASATYVPVSPSTEGLSGDQLTATLYFEFRSEGLLATESRIVETSVDTRVEQRVIEELISGPSAASSELTSLFPANVSVMNVEAREGVLFVTLSKEFLDAPTDAPAGWETDDYWSVEVPARRRLALQSIVCAITDLGTYNSVQLLVDSDNGGDLPGARVLRSYFYTDAGESIMLEPEQRDESAVLTPRNTVSVVLGYLQSKNWDALYQYIAPQDSLGSRPESSGFSADMQSADYTLVSFSVGDAMVSDDGQTATVCCGAQLTYKDKSSRTPEKFPLRLRRDAGVWKITYASLMALLEE